MSSNRPISRAGIGSFSRSKTTSSEVEQALLRERAHHVVPSGEVVEERSIRDVGALADVFDRRGGHALIQEQVERRTQNPVAHLLLAPVHPVHGCEPSATLPQSLSDKSHSSAACASSTAYGATSSRIAAVREIHGTDVGQFLAHRRPHLRRRPVFGHLEVAAHVDASVCAGIRRLEPHQAREVLARHVARQGRRDDAGMHRVGTHAAATQPSVQLDHVQDIGGLRCSVGGELVVFPPLPVGVVQVDVAHPVPVRRQNHDAGALQAAA